ncbi:hypothetical protein EJ04DRAFT_50958 [Polyplosphaeria fusca]|uniref:Uncharacterized protein n=1 Tax=Polyplosphaeria fusca TaxID=682080 RepID=A0A9P4R599_9PLEO|nr:hypothetical protein EJ04DRAFT_50958 [Polyplosphaeria fusca]
MASPQSTPVSLPRVAITYCTQCRWMLRAAYFGQELLSTFGTQIGEIALIPATGGLFTVDLTYAVPATPQDSEKVDMEKVLLWDRKTQGGFPETKVLKQLVRDCIDPGRDLGHSDKHGKKEKRDENAQDNTKVGLEEITADSGTQKEESVAKSELQTKESTANSEEQISRNSGVVCEDCQ